MKKYAIRKHVLLVDLHIHTLYNDNLDGSMTEPPVEYHIDHLKSVIWSAIIKGLDVIGIVSRQSFDAGRIAQQIIKDNNYDLICYAGVEVESEEGLTMVVFEGKSIPSNNTPFKDVCKKAHTEGGFVMAIQPTKRNTQRLNKVAGTIESPDFVEIFNDVTYGGYLKAFVDTGLDAEYTTLMNSAARNSFDLENSNMISRVSRKKFVDIGVLGEDEGADYTPPYLVRENIGDQQWQNTV